MDGVVVHCVMTLINNAIAAMNSKSLAHLATISKTLYGISSPRKAFSVQKQRDGVKKIRRRQVFNNGIDNGSYGPFLPINAAWD